LDLETGRICSLAVELGERRLGFVPTPATRERASGQGPAAELGLYSGGGKEKSGFRLTSFGATTWRGDVDLSPLAFNPLSQPKFEKRKEE
jgi:hypothetical protein